MNIEIPFDNEAECSVLTCMLYRSQERCTGLDFLDESYFYHDDRKSIFSAIKECSKKNKVDTLILKDYLRNNGKGHIIETGSFDEVCGETVPSLHFQEWLNLLKKNRLARKIIELNLKIEKGIIDQKNPEDILESSAKKILDLSNTYNVAKSNEMDVMEIYEQIMKSEQGEIVDDPIPLGFKKIDYKFNEGIRSGELIVIGALASVGKTTFTVNTITNMMNSTNARIDFYSLEQKGNDIGTKFLSIDSELDYSLLRKRKLSAGLIKNDEEFNALKNSCERFNKYKKSGRLNVDCMPNLQVHNLRARIINRIQNGGLDCVFIDYIQRMKTSGYDARLSKVEQTAKISNAMKEIALEFNIRMFIVSQLTKNKNKVSGSEPDMSDLRWTGDLSQDADGVILLYRDSAGNIKAKLAKNRHGAITEGESNINLKMDLHTHYLSESEENDYNKSKIEQIKSREEGFNSW